MRLHGVRVHALPLSAPQARAPAWCPCHTQTCRSGQPNRAMKWPWLACTSGRGRWPTGRSFPTTISINYAPKIEPTNTISSAWIRQNLTPSSRTAMASSTDSPPPHHPAIRISQATPSCTLYTSTPNSGIEASAPRLFLPPAIGSQRSDFKMHCYGFWPATPAPSASTRSTAGLPTATGAQILSGASPLTRPATCATFAPASPTYRIPTCPLTLSISFFES